MWLALDSSTILFMHYTSSEYTLMGKRTVQTPESREKEEV